MAPPPPHLKPQMPAGTQRPAGLPPPIKVEITDLSFGTPDPQVGDSVIIRLTIKNTGTVVAAPVPWAIHLYTGNQTLASTPVIDRLEPGQSIVKTATWPSRAGTFRFQGYVDPTGKALKNTAPASSQVRELELSVAQISGYDLGTAECIRPGTSFGVRGTGFGAQGPRRIAFGGHGRGGPLEIVSWSDSLIRVTLPASTALDGGRQWYYAGLRRNQRWISNIDRRRPATTPRRRRPHLYRSYPGCGRRPCIRWQRSCLGRRRNWSVARYLRSRFSSCWCSGS